MSIYDPIHAYDLTVLTVSRDVLTRVKDADDVLTAVNEQYGWAGIGKPMRDPETLVWLCHVACTWTGSNTMVVTGRDAYDALKAAMELVEGAVKMHRKAGHQVFFRDYGERGSEWIPDNDEISLPNLKILTTVESTVARKLKTAS